MVPQIGLSLKGPDVEIWLGEYTEGEATSILAGLSGFSQEHIAETYVKRVNKNNFSLKFSGGKGVIIEIIIKRIARR
jgi:hypothetical protein